MKILAAAALIFMQADFAQADSVILKNAEEIKGVIVEEYQDRIVISTWEGEKEINKSDINKISFDEAERNLVSLGDKYKLEGRFYEAYDCYSKAYKINPQFTQARDGMYFVSGYLFRKTSADKEREVQRRQEIEEGFNAALKEKPDEERLLDELGIELGSKGKDFVVTLVRNGSPAEEAGIRAGDIIISIWGKLTGYMPLKDVVGLLLKAEIGEIRLVVERGITLNVMNEPLKPYNSLIGADFEMRLDGLTVVKTAEGGAAYRAGLMDGDLVVTLDGKSTRYMPLKNAIKIIEGKKGKDADVVIWRETALWKRKKEI